MLRLASLYYVVISVSGTVVLETDEQFAEVGLIPVDTDFEKGSESHSAPAGTPAPSTLVLPLLQPAYGRCLAIVAGPWMLDAQGWKLW